jgi:DNA-binding MarR family transcriptional regulator
LKVLDANPGNLSRKLERLSQVGYIKIRRDFINNKRMMIVEITQKGLQAYVEYMEDFQQYQKAYQKIKTLQS